MQLPKVIVVGAGMVGGSAALLIHLAVPSSEVIIVDIDETRAEGQAEDIAHASGLWRSMHIAAGDYEDTRDADVIVIAAGAAVKAGQSRLDLAQTNVAVVKDIISNIGERAPNAIYIVATNPVDILGFVVQRLTGLPSERVISTGTSLDTARLRSLLSDRLDVVPAAIYADVLGEHGDSSMIHWSGASISGLPLDNYLEATGHKMGPATRDMMKEAVRDAAMKIRLGKGVSHYGIGSAIARICQAVIHDSNIILPVATVHSEVEGIPDVCLSLPCLIGNHGARWISYPLLNADEQNELVKSAEVVKKAQEKADHLLNLE